jgi:hypothetical protein
MLELHVVRFAALENVQFSCGIRLFPFETDRSNQWLNQRIVGTVITKASVETRSIEAASDSMAL